ncbi:MAG: ester cyclase [Pseudomonadota bacterium]
MSEESRAMTRRLIDEVNKGNLDVLDEYYTSDFILHQPPFPDIRGLAVFKRFQANMRTSFPDVQWTIDEMISEGDQGAVRITWRGTNTGQSKFLPFPPTGKQVTWSGCVVSRMAGGKIIESWNYADNLGLMQQLGIIPPMG